LSLLLATLDAPHLLILDEPTNHLDIESREALVNALTDYSGAVILVSHDMHLLSLVADRLWLVKDGRVAPYEDDLEAYRAMLLQGDEKPKEKSKPEKPKRTASREDIANLRTEVRKCEERLEKLNEMRDKLAKKPGMGSQAETWQKKYAEVMGALDRAEALWLNAQEKLEQAAH
jgi:ATP-binding cassette, subfamily F, member 3